MEMLKLVPDDFVKAWPWTCLALDRVLGTKESPKFTQRNYGHLVVMEHRLLRVGSDPRDAIVFEKSHNRELWPEGKRCDVKARVKTWLSAMEKSSTRLVLRNEKYEPQPGDFPWPGALYKSGFAVGFSGQEAHHDEMVDRIELAFAIAIAYADTVRNPTVVCEQADPDTGWVGEPPAWALYEAA